MLRLFTGLLGGFVALCISAALMVSAGRWVDPTPIVGWWQTVVVEVRELSEAVVNAAAIGVPIVGFVAGLTIIVGLIRNTGRIIIALIAGAAALFGTIGLALHTELVPVRAEFAEQSLLGYAGLAPAVYIAALVIVVVLPAVFLRRFGAAFASVLFGSIAATIAVLWLTAFSPLMTEEHRGQFIEGPLRQMFVTGWVPGLFAIPVCGYLLGAGRFRQLLGGIIGLVAGGLVMAMLADWRGSDPFSSLPASVASAPFVCGLALACFGLMLLARTEQTAPVVAWTFLAGLAGAALGTFTAPYWWNQLEETVGRQGLTTGAAILSGLGFLVAFLLQRTRRPVGSE